MGVFQVFSMNGSKHGWVNCNCKTRGQSHEKIQAYIQCKAWHSEGYIPSIYLSFSCLHWGELSPMLRWMDLITVNKEDKTATLIYSGESSIIYALELSKKNIPFLYHLLWYSRIFSKNLKTVTILISTLKSHPLSLFEVWSYFITNPRGWDAK